MTIIHVIPANNAACGGIKVHYQLAHLEKALGHNAIVAYPLMEEAPSWFPHACQVISWQDAFELAKQHPDDCMVIGREEPSEVLPWPAKHKVCYVQGESLMFSPPDAFKGVTTWYSSLWNRSSCRARGYADGPVVFPYVDSNEFYPSKEEKFVRKPYTVLVQLRKNGKLRWREVEQHLGKAADSFAPIFVPEVPQPEFAEHLRTADILFAHSYPEGFGLPSLEAMYSGTLVVGYAGGGGTDFLRDRANSFLAPDGHPEMVAHALEEVAQLDPSVLRYVVRRGLESAHLYNELTTIGWLAYAIRRIVGGETNAVL
jgi:hypothetical protein